MGRPPPASRNAERTRMPEKSVIRTEAAPAPFQGAPSNRAGEAIQEQTEQVFSTLAAILEAAGSSLERLVKTTVFLQRLDDFAGMNEVYAARVGAQPPARSTVEVGKLPSGALVEIEAIAHL